MSGCPVHDADRLMWGVPSNGLRVGLSMRTRICVSKCDVSLGALWKPAFEGCRFTQEIGSFEGCHKALQSLALRVCAVYCEAGLRSFEGCLYLRCGHGSGCNMGCFLNCQLPQCCLIFADLLSSTLSNGLVKQHGELIKVLSNVLNVLEEGLSGCWLLVVYWCDRERTWRSDGIGWRRGLVPVQCSRWDDNASWWSWWC
eukprot:1077500-Amphidinium_carterae.1